MKIKVTTEEICVTEHEYYVDGVNTLENAAKCVQRCYNHEYQPNTYCSRTVPRPPQLKIVSYEIVED